MILHEMKREAAKLWGGGGGGEVGARNALYFYGNKPEKMGALSVRTGSAAKTKVSIMTL
jgi:hypothetical protein